MQGSDGNFYGTTSSGGSNNFGTLFQMTPSGKLRTLVTFNDRNGNSPEACPVQAADGTLYGITSYGGLLGYGTVFKLSAGLPPVSLRFAAPPLAETGATLLKIIGPPGTNYFIEASSNLANWTGIALVTNLTGAVQFIDTAATNLQ